MARLHLLIPSLMVGGIVLATLLALAHHLFYQSLNGVIVGSESQQAWYVRIGTGLAFLAKSFLTASMAIGYTQLLWHNLRSRPISLKGVDALFGAVGNLWHFTNWELWIKGPSLAITALLIWFIPLIAVVTPSTLSIQVSPQPNLTVVNMAIPNLYYNSTDINKWVQTTSGSSTDAKAASLRMQRITSAVASYGSMLQVAAPYPNSSYSLDFYGPTMKCGEPNVGLVGNTSFQTSVVNTIAAWQKTKYVNTVRFVSWYPSSVHEGARGVIDGLNDTLWQAEGVPYYDQAANDSSRVFMTIPVPYTDSGTPKIATNHTIQCNLYNASYSVNFTWVNGVQDIKVTNLTPLNGVTSFATNPNYTPELKNDTLATGQAIAYDGVLLGLTSVLNGFLVTDHYSVMTPYVTGVLKSVFYESQELQLLSTTTTIKNDPGPLTVRNLTMADMIEEVFANVTLSLFSDSFFLQNATQGQAIRPVTVSTPQNAYSYNPHNLWIAYGIGIAVAVTIVGIGLACIVSVGDSFGASFSAILRTTRNLDLDAVVPPHETHGTYPIGRELGRTKLVVQRTPTGFGDEDRTAFVVVETPSSAGDSASAEKRQMSWKFRSVATRRVSVDSLLQEQEGQVRVQQQPHVTREHLD